MPSVRFLTLVMLHRKEKKTSLMTPVLRMQMSVDALMSYVSDPGHDPISFFVSMIA